LVCCAKKTLATLISWQHQEPAVSKHRSGFCVTFL
jgi:hypothetical protein